MVANKKIKLEELAGELYKTVSMLERDELQESLAESARHYCKKHKPTITSEANSKIKKVVSSSPYTANFTVKRVKDGERCGATLWNRKYTLSHLIEEPHSLVGWYAKRYGGSRTHNNYKFWSGESNKMCKEFEDNCKRRVDKFVKKIAEQ